jgi:hypothetical protein
MIMRTLLVISVLCLLPTFALAQIKSDPDQLPEKIKPSPNEVIKSDHDALKADRYHSTDIKEHEAKERLKCRMVLTKPHHKHVRCS